MIHHHNNLQLSIYIYKYLIKQIKFKISKFNNYFFEYLINLILKFNVFLYNLSALHNT
jgi:hypothetical protein